MTGRVERIEPGRVVVRLSDGRVVYARNTIAVRCPPGSTVVLLDTGGTWDIVGRRR